MSPEPTAPNRGQAASQGHPNPAADPLATRTTLLLRIRNPDDNESWREFVALYRDMIAARARQHGLSRDLAQDAVQQVLAEINERIHQFDIQQPSRSFRAWIKTLIAWRSAEVRRKESRFLCISDKPDWEAWLHDVAGAATVPPLPDALMDDAIRWAAVERALNRVRRRVHPMTFKAFDLLVFKELPVREVARLTGLNHSSIYTAKSRVLSSLREEVSLMAHDLR